MFCCHFITLELIVLIIFLFQVLGLPSQAVGFSLCQLLAHLGRDISVETGQKKAEEIFVEACKGCIAEHFLEAQLPPLTTLLGAYDVAWRKEDLARSVFGAV